MTVALILMFVIIAGIILFNNMKPSTPEVINTHKITETTVEDFSVVQKKDLLSSINNGIIQQNKLLSSIKSWIQFFGILTIACFVLYLIF